MKKVLILFITAIIIVSNLTGLSDAYCNIQYTSAPLSAGEKSIQTFVYKDLDNLNKRINVLAKNAIEIKKGSDQDKINEYIKDLEAVLSDISYLLTEIRIEYENYKEDLSISNGMLSIGSIATNFRVATVQLKEYLVSQNLEEEYRTLGNFFKAMIDGENSLNKAKSYIPKP